MSVDAIVQIVVCLAFLWTALERVSRSWLKPLVQTSVLFALLHLVRPGGFHALPYFFVAGLLLGIVRLRSGSLVPAVHAHFVVDALWTIN